MRRIVGILVVLAALTAVFVTGVGADHGDGGSYEVRAIFDNAGFLVKGEEVRIAGAKVGTISDVDVTTGDEAALEDGGPDPGKAVVVLNIDDPAFQDFRADASCLIRPQSLIGEKYVECDPTQPRAPNTEAPPELTQIPDGEPGEGQYLLPLERNGKSVDLDLVNNIMREPYPDRFRLILNDLGAGFAARGKDLAEIVDRSNPALRETNEVLAILARQNKTLATLAGDSDRVITALAAQREHLGNFINQSEVAARATAERRADLEETFRRFPSFLVELRSTMSKLDRFSRAATPTFADLRQAAPSLTRLSEALGPFSSAGTTAITSLGDASEASGPDLVASDPVIRQVRSLAKSGAPATTNLKKTLVSLRKTGGYKKLTEFIFNSSGAVNPFDQYGHFMRSLLPANNCVSYVVIVESGCDTNFNRSTTASAPATAKDKRSSKRAQQPSGAAPRDATGQAADAIPDVSIAPREPAPTTPDMGDGLETDPGTAAPETLPEPRSDGAAAAGAAKNMRAARDLLDFLIGDSSANSKPKSQGKGKR